MAKKAYIGVENFTRRALPIGYTQIEYIQSSGTQYIDTGFKPNQNTGVTIDFQLNVASGWQCVFGTRVGNNTLSYSLWHSGSAFGFYYSSVNATFSNLAGTVRHTVVATKNTAVADGASSVSSTYSNFTANYPLFLFAVNSDGQTQSIASMKLYSCQIYDNGILVRDFVPCTNSSGTVGLYDMTHDVFYTDAAGGTFTAGTSSYSSVARKIKVGYIGIDDIARNIKKAYIGIGGVARPCWGSGELKYYGKITNLSLTRYDCEHHGITFDNRAFFFQGGSTGAMADVYDSTLTKSTAGSSTSSRTNGATASVGNYALYAGGYASSVGQANVYAISKSLTQSTPTALPNAAYSLAGASNGSYALFAGGHTGGSRSSAVVSTVTAYNSSLTRSSASVLTVARHSLGSARAGNYALFAGGMTYYQANSRDSYRSNVVNAYNASLTRSTPTTLSSARQSPAGVTLCDNAIFAGGATGSSYVSSVERYDTSLTRSVLTALSSIRETVGTNILDEVAVFAGGFGGSYLTVAEYYDKDFVKSSTTSLGAVKSSHAAASAGKYGIFAGGRGSGGNGTNTAYAYEFS